MSEPTQIAPARTPPVVKGGISLVFVVLLLVFAGAAFELAIGRGGQIGTFVFVFVGWTISLCLHEWGHAVTAWWGGDRSIAERGYLTLDPLKYANPVMSILFPLAILAMGGVGFPGGAVYVNKDALRTPLWRAGVSAAGPAMNVLCLLALALLLHFVRVNNVFAGAIAFLALLQATAFVLNLLPIPGLDGFGILESVLPASERAAVAQIGRVASLIFLVVIIAVPQVFIPIWNVATRVCGWVGLSIVDMQNGYDLFHFWSQ